MGKSNAKNAQKEYQNRDIDLKTEGIKRPASWPAWAMEWLQRLGYRKTCLRLIQYRPDAGKINLQHFVMRVVPDMEQREP